MKFPTFCALRAAPWLAAASLALGCGEGDGLERAAVSGKVTLDEKPLSKGSIQFVPKGGDSRGAAWGQVVDGSYAIPASEGPAPGTYAISITPEIAGSPSAALEADAAPGEPPAEASTPTYVPTTPLEANIEAGKPNTFDYGLTTGKAARPLKR